MKKLSKILKVIKKSGGIVNEQGEDGLACQIPRTDYYGLCIIASWGEGWEHISVHARIDEGMFTPFWDDMTYVKDIFFKSSETVLQYHPPKTVYVNNHQNVLHLWREQGVEIKLPPKWMV